MTVGRRNAVAIFALSLIAVLVGLAGLHIVQYRIPMARSELVGTWIGQNSERPSCLTFRADGTFVAWGLPRETFRSMVYVADDFAATGEWGADSFAIPDPSPPRQFAMTITTVNDNPVYAKGKRYAQHVPLKTEWAGPFRTIGFYIGDPDIPAFYLQYRKSAEERCAGQEAGDR